MESPVNSWTPLAELPVDVCREGLPAYVRAQLGAGLRRAGLSTEFTLAGAVACWRSQEAAPVSPCLALIWTNPSCSGAENAECLRELLEEGGLPMPFQFIASQPHMAAVHASRFFPGLAHATTLLHASEDVENVLLPALALRRPWTHVLLGEVETPPPGPKGDRFRAHWRVLARRVPPEASIR